MFASFKFTPCNLRYDSNDIRGCPIKFGNDEMRLGRQGIVIKPDATANWICRQVQCIYSNDLALQNLPVNLMYISAAIYTAGYRRRPNSLILSGASNDANK